MRPEVFGDFILVQRLSTSSMAEAFVAVRLGERSGRTYVVKRPSLVERESGRSAQAIQREAEVLEAVNADGLVRLAASGTIAALPYLAVEHLRAVSVHVLLRDGPLTPAQASIVGLDVARALQALHEAGWVHGDVGPNNVLVDDEGHAHLIDLGLAAVVGTRTTELAGTAGYVAPEVVRGAEVHPAMDVYGLGAVIAECALGEPLFPELELYEAASRASEPTRLDRVDPAIAALVAPCLERDASKRPSAASLAEGLALAARDRAALAERVLRAMTPALTPSPAAPPPPLARASSRPPPPPARPLARPAEPRNAWRLLAVSLMLLIVGTGGVFVGRRGARSGSTSIDFAGTFPRNSSIELDGVPTAPAADGSPLPLSPGQHTVTVRLRDERRQYSFSARPGERVVLVPLLVPSGRAGGAAEPRSSRKP